MKTHPISLACTLAAVLMPLPASAQQISGWGLNVQGQTTVPPAVVEPVRVASGTYHATALLRNGSVVAWGTDVNGSLTVPAGLSGVIQLECAYYTNYALKSDGTVTAWGDNWWTQRDLPPWLGNVVALAGGGNHALALNTDGLVVAWGSNAEGQLDVPPAVQRRTLQIAAGGYHSLAISESGIVTAWGGNANGQTTVPAGLGVCRAVAGGLSHTLALKADGTVAAWGLNSSGQCNVPAGLTNVIAIAAGYWHSTALRADGTVVAWGHNAYGQSSAPAGLSGAAAVESGGSHSLALTSDASRAPDIISAARALTTATATQFHYRAAALHGPVTWSIAGSLPAGLAFDAAHGVLTGTTAAGTYNVQLQAANGTGSDTHTLQLTVINNALPSLAEALDAPQLPVWSDSWWRADASAQAHDSVDQAWCESLPCTNVTPQFGSYFCSASAHLRTSVRGPARLTCWLGVLNNFGVDVFLNASATGLAGPMTPAGGDGPWSFQTMDLGPGLHTVTWSAGMFAYFDGFPPPTVGAGASVNEVSFAPLPTLPVADALDLAGGWTSSAPDSWTGLAAAHAHDGVDYACMAQPAVAFSTAWIERAFTGPARVQWRWRTEAGAGSLRVLQNGAVALTAGAGSQTAWESQFIDLPAGAHTLRWEGQSSHTGAPVVAALDAMAVLPSVTFADVLGSTGLTWTTGGTAPWTAVTDSGVSGHPTLAAVAPAAGQDGWLETTVTGPGMLSFWAGAPPGNPILTVTAAGVAFPVSFSYQAQAQQRLSLPAGSHAVRFFATSAMQLDDVTWSATSDTAAARIELPSTPVLEQRLGSSALGALNAGTTYTCADYRTLTFSPPAHAQPWTLRFSARSHWIATPALTNGSVSPATLSSQFVLCPPGVPFCTFATQTSAPCELENVSTVAATPTGLFTAWSSVHPAIVSEDSRVRGLSNFGKTLTSRSVWLDANSTDSAWLQMTITGPLLLTFDKLGQGQYRINGGAPVFFDYSNGWGEQRIVVPAGAPATVRIETLVAASATDLVLENLRTTAPAGVPLADALENSALTPGGAGAWTGYDFAPWADGMGDFAESPFLVPGLSSWLEGTLTGPFEFSYRLADAGSRLRLEIDGIVQADTQVAPGNGTFRVQVAEGRARRYRFIASGGVVRIGGIATPTDSMLYYIGQSTLAGMESVFWGQNVQFHPVFPLQRNAPAELGVFVTGPARVRCRMEVTYMVPQIWLPPTATGSATLSLAGNTWSGNGSEMSLPVTGGLQAAVVTLLSGAAGYPNPPWPQEYGSYVSWADAWLYSFGIEYGNADYRTWAAAQGLTGFDSLPAADRDGDGLGNDLEFLLGTVPTAGNAAPLSPSHVAGRLQVRVPFPPHATAGSALRFQTSPDLQQWTTAGPEALVQTAGGLRFYEAPAGARFARFGATVTP